MEEVTEEYIDLNYFVILNDLLLYCVTLTKPFREDVLKIRNKYNLNVGIIREKLRDLNLDYSTQQLLLSHNVLTPRDVAYVKRVMAEIDEKSTKDPITQLAEIRANITKVGRFEKKFLPSVEINKLAYKYRLPRNYRRRLKSIVLYDDYPTKDKFFPVKAVSDKDMQSLNDMEKKFRKKERSTVSGNLEIKYHYNDNNDYEYYYEIRIYGDTDLSKLDSQRKFLERLQCMLPNYRKLIVDNREYLLRDATYYDLFVNHNLSFKDANKRLEELNLEPYTNLKNANKAKRCFEKLAFDQYEHYSKKHPDKNAPSKNYPPHIPSFD